jgi:hypothetical protein
VKNNESEISERFCFFVIISRQVWFLSSCILFLFFSSFSLVFFPSVFFVVCVLGVFWDSFVHF